MWRCVWRVEYLCEVKVKAGGDMARGHVQGRPSSEAEVGDCHHAACRQRAQQRETVFLPW